MTYQQLRETYDAATVEFTEATNAGQDKEANRLRKVLSLLEQATQVLTEGDVD